MDTIQVSKPGDTRSGMTILREWLEENNTCILQKGCKEKESHMSLLGWPYGRLLIPDNIHGSWLTEYTKELQRGVHSLFFAERKTPVFRMHFDLDFNQPAPVTLDYIEMLARDANKVFRGFFPDMGADSATWRVLVLTAPPKPVEKDGVHSVKSGSHLIWPALHVDQAIALQLRLNLLDHIRRTWPPRDPGSNPYDDIVDETVLKSNGLRMYGSDKASKCTDCKRARSNCETCLGLGTIVENRAYTLATVLSPLGGTDQETLDSLTSNLFACVTMSSIRVSSPTPTPGFKVPVHAVSNEVVKRARAAASKRPTPGGGPPGSEVIDRSCPIFDQLQGYIRSKLSTQLKWVGIDLKHIFLLKKKGVYICKVDGPGSLYCENVGRAHSSSTIYFEVSSDGITQRCFSPKVTNGMSCKSYRGRTVPINNWLRDAMFGSNKFVPYVETFKVNIEGDDMGTSDPFSNFPNPDYPGMTFGEVTRITNPLHRKELKQKCLSTLPDPRTVYAGIVKEVPMVIAAKKRKR